MSCLFDAQKKYRVIMKDAVPLEKMATVVGEHWPSLEEVRSSPYIGQA